MGTCTFDGNIVIFVSLRRDRLGHSTVSFLQKMGQIFSMIRFFVGKNRLEVAPLNREILLFEWCGC